MRKPLEGNYPVTQTFAEHLQRKIDNGWKNYNGGIDYGVPIGTPIYAAQNGQIEKVADDPSGYGTHILISHSSGLETLYGHLSTALVKVGQEVTAGQMIGRSGSTGNSTGPHLHFEARQNGVSVDPETLYASQATQSASQAASQPAFTGQGLYKITTGLLNARLAPGGDDRGDLLINDQVEVVGGPVQQGGLSWVPVKLWVATGFDGENYLEKVS